MEPTTGIEPVNLFLTKEALYLLSYVGGIRFISDGAGDEVRTRDIQLGRLKLCQLSYSRTRFFMCIRIADRLLTPIKRPESGRLVVGGGFEPPKALPADLQSAPFGRSGTPPLNIKQLEPAKGLEPPTH